MKLADLFGVGGGPVRRLRPFAFFVATLVSGVVSTAVYFGYLGLAQTTWSLPIWLLRIFLFTGLSFAALRLAPNVAIAIVAVAVIYTPVACLLDMNYLFSPVRQFPLWTLQKVLSSAWWVVSSLGALALSLRWIVPIWLALFVGTSVGMVLNRFPIWAGTRDIAGIAPGPVNDLPSILSGAIAFTVVMSIGLLLTSTTPYHPPTTPVRQQPQHKGFAIASLVLGVLSIPCLGLFGIGAIVGLILGIIAIVRAEREPAIYGGTGLAIAGVITNSLGLLLLPAVIISNLGGLMYPILYQWRVSSAEEQAITDVRTVVAAEAAYAKANGGFYDNLDCLAAPANCIPGYPPNAATYISAELATVSVKDDYVYTFHPGPPAEFESTRGARISSSSLISFAYVAVPAGPGATRMRTFCGDSNGQICVTDDGMSVAPPPDVTGGMCPETCSPLN